MSAEQAFPLCLRPNHISNPGLHTAIYDTCTKQLECSPGNRESRKAAWVPPGTPHGLCDEVYLACIKPMIESQGQGYRVSAGLQLPATEVEPEAELSAAQHPPAKPRALSPSSVSRRMPRCCDPVMSSLVSARMALKSMMAMSPICSGRPVTTCSEAIFLSVSVKHR